MEPKQLIIGAVVFPGWYTLDLCGPISLMGSIQGIEPLPKVEMYTITSPTQTDKLVKSFQNFTAKADFHFNDKNIPAVLVAATGLLDGKQATTNKQAIKYHWNDLVIGAGMDMALDFIREVYGEEVAIATAQAAEYDWHQDPHYDPFAKKLGLSNSKDSELGYFV
nr:12722_t:CDS:2 [Entrophospora candida]